MDKEYCPDCGSMDVSGKFMVSRDGYDIYEYSCRDCQSIWEDWQEITSS